MAISNAMLDEVYYLRDRIRKASSSAEARHYEDMLYRLEGKIYEKRYDINTDFHVKAQRCLPPVNTAPTPEPQTPLSFLKDADKKLLLTGEIA